MPQRKNPNTGVEQRRREVARVDDITGKVHSVTGIVTIDGVGEGLVEVRFPVMFLSKPNFSHGSELFPNMTVTPQQFPTCTAMVIGWETKEPDEGRRFYVGANLAVVTTGESWQRFYVHWRMEGIALRNPVAPVDVTTDDEI